MKSTQKGTLPIGVEYGGKIHKDFEIRPRLVRDQVEAMENNPRARRNEAYAGLCIAARQIVSLGEIHPEVITPDFLMDNMNALDMDEIMRAHEALEGRLRTFPGELEGNPV